ncbi:tRNA lysidine(34) synthetase TilS [Bacteroidota bacterium]
MQNNIDRFIHQHQLFTKEETVLVAVSGGVDSMVLAQLLLDNGYRIAVAHCNFQLRAEDSERDMEFVSDWCKRHKIPFHCKRIPTKELVVNSGSSTQMVARNERYQFFSDLMDEHNYSVTATAHHAGDKVETILINVLRGTGVRGLAGIRVKRDRYVRPILFASKDEIRAYADQNGIANREDKSNAKIDYQRNWVRLRLLPMLRQIDPDVDEKLILFGNYVEKKLSVCQRWIEIEKVNLFDENNPRVIPMARLNQSLVPFTLMKEILHPFGFSTHQVFEVLNLANSESGLEVASGQLRVVRNRGSLLLDAMVEQEKPTLTLDEVDRKDVISFETPNNIALLDAEKLDKKDLKLRHWGEGDRFKPLGMKNWKKLSDFFIDQKLSVIDKKNVWLLTYKGEIVWVIGHRIDDRFKITKETQKVLKIITTK